MNTIVKERVPDVMEAIKERRSINFFEKDFPLPTDKIRELLNISNLAPSSFDLQPWKVIVVTDEGRKKALRKCAMDQIKVEEASCVLIIVADPDALEENENLVLDSWQTLGYMKPEARGPYKDMMHKLYGEAGSLTRKLFAVKNASLFAMNLMVAAKGMSLDTHPMDGFDEDAIKHEFNIPDNKVIPMIIALGVLRKGITLLPRAFRRDIEEFTRFE